MTGNVIVVGPSVAFYEGLLPSFRGTPEPKVSLTDFFANGIEAVKEVVRKIAESWDIETITGDGETSAENNSSAILLIRGDVGRYLLTTGDTGIPALSLAADVLDVWGFDYDQLKFA